ncbi:MAG: hypothetical protein HWN67_01985 [Candidatus Helarchaeota archaeon]|nr:hypothetical protein [Candidatus Helarchaeota archaeon]
MNIRTFPKKLKIKLIIAIPSSILENCQDLRSKTEKIGIIARTCAIFKVEEIYIYPHYFKTKNSIRKNNLEFITTIFNYLECPPYLRKRKFPISPFLKFSGLLPPLKIAHHILKNKFENLESGETREGLVIESNDKFSKIDIGFNQKFYLDIPNLKIDRRITIFLKIQNSKMKISMIDPKNLKYYWGYKVYIKDLKHILDYFKDFCIIITSKYGKNIMKNKTKLINKILQVSKLLIVFGAPFEGLLPIFEKKKIKIQNNNFFNLNMIPHQGTETITTEEAIISSLSILNFLYWDSIQ